MQVYRTDVLVSGELCDVHARLERGTVAFCGVYVRPQGPVPGYWYFPSPEDAASLLGSLGAP